MSNDKLYQLNYQIKELEKQKGDTKKELIENKLTEVTKMIIEENSKSQLNERELKVILKAFSYDLKNIITD